MKKILSGEKGFTLIEAMISVVILVVGLLAIIELFTLSVNGRRTGKDLSIANNLAKMMIEEMKNRTYNTAINEMAARGAEGDDYWYKAPTDPTPAGLTREQKVVTANKEFTIQIIRVEDSPSADLATVTVSVLWSSNGQPHKVSYTTYFYM